MTSDWEISRTTGKCAVTDRVFAEGETFFAAMFETPEGLQRRDYAVDAWTGPPEGCFCYWRGRVPLREERSNALAVDQEMLTHLFCRLEDEESEMRQQFRFVLALLLMRKRRLKLEGTIQDGGREYWQVRLMSDGSEHRVLNPRLAGDEVNRLSAQLTAILSGEIHAIESLDRIGTPAPRAEPGETRNADEVRGAGEPDSSAGQAAAGSEDGVATP